MKKLSYLIILIFIFGVWSCSDDPVLSKDIDKTSEDAKSEYKCIKSVQEFENLFLQQGEPFNKISESTFIELKNSIHFDKYNIFRGFGMMEGLNEDLNIEEMSEFFNRLCGVNMILVEFPGTDEYFYYNPKNISDDTGTTYWDYTYVDQVVGCEFVWNHTCVRYDTDPWDPPTD